MPTTRVVITIAQPQDFCSEEDVRLQAKKVVTPAATDAHGTRIVSRAGVPLGSTAFSVDVLS